MDEYIKREAVIEAIENDCLELVYYTKEDAIQCVKAIPAADVAEVVRCKDCKYYAAMVTDMVIGDMETATWGICRQPWFNSDEYDVDEDGFCNYGAKMDKEAADDKKQPEEAPGE